MANPYFNATFYLQSNPDLLAAGVTVATAWDHYVNFGANEAYVAGGFTRAPNDWFDARFYLESNPDLITAGVTPDTALDHFAKFGAAELRSPNAQIAQNPVTDASLLAYVNANADVAAFAGVTVPATTLTAAEQAAVVGQFYAYGIDEARPAAPTQFTPTPINPDPGQTFTFTTAAGETITGTAGNDTFNGIVGTADTTFQTGDTADGGAGVDTLNLVVSSAAPALPAGATVKNIEVVNLNVSSFAAGSTLLTSNAYVGVEQLWQINNSATAANFQNVAVGSGVTAGFRSTGTTAGSTVAATVNGTTATQNVGSAALDGVLTGSALTFGTVGAMTTVNVAGSVVTSGGANALTLTTDTVTTKVNVGLTSNTTLTIVEGTAGTTQSIDLSGSTGNLTLNVGKGAGFSGLKALDGGAGNDRLTVDFDDNADKLAVNGGAGNDTITVAATVANGATIGNEGKITLGEGKDTVKLAAVADITNISAATVDATTLVQNIITVTDFSTAEDVLDMSGAGLALTTAQLNTINSSANLLSAVQAAAAITDIETSAKAVAFSWGGDAYVYIDNGFDGLNQGDGLIKLAGVDATEFTNIQNGNLIL